MRLLYIFTFTLLVGLSSFAQSNSAATCNVSIEMVNNQHGWIVAEVTPKSGFHIYSFENTNGPINASFSVKETPTVELVGNPAASLTPTKKFDNDFGAETFFWDKPVIIRQKFRVIEPTQSVKGYFRFQGCNGGNCAPPKKIKFDIKLDPK